MDDLPRLAEWFKQPHVREWYARDDLTYSGIVAKYGPRTEQASPVRSYLILIDDVEVGYIQAYSLASFPEYDALVGADPGTVGLDLFLGEPRFVHRGFGSRVIRRFLDDMVFADRKVRACVAGPALQNTASIRAFEKAGFRKWKLITTSPHETEHLLRIERLEENAA